MALPLIALAGTLLRSNAAKKAGKFIGTAARSLIQRARNLPTSTLPTPSMISPAAPTVSTIPLQSAAAVINLNQAKTRGGYVGTADGLTEKTRGGGIVQTAGGVVSTATDSAYQFIFGDENKSAKGGTQSMLLYVGLGLVAYMLLKK